MDSTRQGNHGAEKYCVSISRMEACKSGRGVIWNFPRILKYSIKAMPVPLRSGMDGKVLGTIPIDWRKTVASPARPTPCNASFHQSYSLIPSRGIAGEEFCINDTFSSCVKRGNFRHKKGERYQPPTLSFRIYKTNS